MFLLTVAWSQKALTVLWNSLNNKDKIQKIFFQTLYVELELEGL
jgi:hypothetical protein